jgi:hypothetical protein
MMLDKSQISEWDGEPETAGQSAPTPKPVAAKPTAEAQAQASDPQRSGLAETIFESREAVPTGETVTLTPEQAKARKRRGQWLALGLFAFVILVFLLTMTKLGANILVRDL